MANGGTSRTAPPRPPEPREGCRADFEALLELVAKSRRLLVLTGAGCSTECGIPDYRDERGGWKRAAPIMYADFVADARVRQRYWARSTLGWRHVAAAAPGPAHHALAALEAAGPLDTVITQNVDGLHGRAGSRRVIELHGGLAQVRCLGCGRIEGRPAFQARLEAANPGWTAQLAAPAPDGDALVEAAHEDFCVPACVDCGGILKPDVVFFGESVPRERVGAAMRRVSEADALLVAGSSLMVFSGFRFVREAARLSLPIAAVNLGRTRADDLFHVKISAACGATLERLAAALHRRETRSPRDATA